MEKTQIAALLDLLPLVPLGLALASQLVLLAAIATAVLRRRRGRREPARPTGQRFTILKPLAGDDDELAENLESFARIDHPDFEILFGVASPNDRAAPVARDFVRRHPEIRSRVIVTDPRAAINPKVAQLIGLEAEATGQVLVISDSNARVASDYLARLEQELRADDVGLVTNLFVGTGETTFGAALENAQLSAFIAPVVAASALYSSRSLTVGKSMAVRRDVLRTIGGLEAVGDVLAEDHLLGRLVREAGYRVALSFATIENRNVACDTMRALERHTRWAKMRRGISPVAFALEPIAEPLLVALVVALLFPSTATLIAFVATALLRITIAYVTIWLLRGHAMPLRYLPIEIARSALVGISWVRALLSRRVSWRGHPFLVGRDSRIVPVRPSRLAARLRRLRA